MILTSSVSIRLSDEMPEQQQLKWEVLRMERSLDRRPRLPAFSVLLSSASGLHCRLPIQLPAHAHVRAPIRPPPCSPAALPVFPPSLLKSSSSATATRTVHAWARTASLPIASFVACCLVRAVGRSVRLARKVFEEIDSPDLASGNALLDALCLTATWPAGRGVEEDGAEERRPCGDKLT